MAKRRRSDSIRKVRYEDQARSLMEKGVADLADMDLAEWLVAVQTTVTIRATKEAAGSAEYEVRRFDDVIPRIKNAVRTWFSANADCVVCFAVQVSHDGRLFENPLDRLAER